MEDSERAVCKLESSFRIRNVGFSVVLTCIFTALYEKCDTTGQMKDIRLPIVHVLLMVLWSRLCLAKDEFRYQEWMIYGGKLIWCDLLTSKIYQVEGTVLVSVRIFVYKVNTYRWKAVNCFSNVARGKYYSNIYMTCYHIPDEKTLQILSLYFVPIVQSAVYIL